MVIYSALHKGWQLEVEHLMLVFIFQQQSTSPFFLMQYCTISFNVSLLVMRDLLFKLMVSSAAAMLHDKINFLLQFLLVIL
jgi:hypothetical protein